jgi:ribonuclease D
MSDETGRADDSQVEVYIPEAPPLINTDDGLRAHLDALRSDTGPVAIDTERGSGFTYNQRPYLIQIASATTDVMLIDPLPLSPQVVAELQETLQPKQWVLHSAGQDLSSLKLIGLTPELIFDTELSARLLGYERVGLGALLEGILGVKLAKEHGHSDWSTRPLPQAWLSYAAGDVEFLIELAQILHTQLREQHRDHWADQEFSWILRAPEPAAKPYPWRSTKDIHRVTTRRGLALVERIWCHRESIAQELDLAPHRIIKDREISSICSLATERSAKKCRGALRRRHWGPNVTREQGLRFVDLIDEIDQLQEKDLPPRKVEQPVKNSPGSWARKKPAALQRWKVLRPGLVDCASQWGVAPEILLSPAALKAVAWEPLGLDGPSVDRQFESLMVRPWQREIVVPLVAGLLS